MLVFQNKFPTSVAYDPQIAGFSFTDEEDLQEGYEYTSKNYDGFAVSENFITQGNKYYLYPSEIFLVNSNLNHALTAIPYSVFIDNGY